MSLSAGDTTFEAALALLERLVGFDTESSKSNLPLVDDVETYLRQHNVDYVRVPNADGDKAALFATIGPKRDDGIVLSGHTDVVPVTGQTWTTDPFKLRRADGRLYGRGACDMKGFDALCLAMIPEFQAADLARPIHILLSYDEETTCLGPVDTIARFGRDLPRPAATIVGEPTSLRVVDAHKSIATYHTSVHGFEAHSAKPNLGASAVQAACALVTELYRFAATLEREGDPSGRFDPPASTIHVGTIAGGTARNILAKLCTFHWEFRGLPGVRQSLALEHLNAYAQDVILPAMRRTAPNASIETLTEVEVPGLDPEPGSAAETLAMNLAGTNDTTTAAFATEAGRFQSAGIPTIVCGPGSIEQAHQPDEYITEAAFADGLAFLRRLAQSLR
jgi:acetylornithine deacetylase